MKKFSLDNIKARRLELGLSTATVAELMGFKNSSVYWKYENGKYKFDADMLPRLAHILKCVPSKFFVD